MTIWIHTRWNELTGAFFKQLRVVRKMLLLSMSQFILPKLNYSRCRHAIIIRCTQVSYFQSMHPLLSICTADQYYFTSPWKMKMMMRKGRSESLGRLYYYIAPRFDINEFDLDWFHSEQDKERHVGFQCDVFENGWEYHRQGFTETKAAVRSNVHSCIKSVSFNSSVIGCDKAIDWWCWI